MLLSSPWIIGCVATLGLATKAASAIEYLVKYQQPALPHLPLDSWDAVSTIDETPAHIIFVLGEHTHQAHHDLMVRAVMNRPLGSTTIFIGDVTNDNEALTKKYDYTAPNGFDIIDIAKVWKRMLTRRLRDVGKKLSPGGQSSKTELKFPTNYSDSKIEGQQLPRDQVGVRTNPRPEELRADQFSSTSTNITPREIEILKALETGVRNSDIAEILNISVNTVHVHIASIFKKLNAKNRIHAVVRAREMGLM